MTGSFLVSGPLAAPVGSLPTTMGGFSAQFGAIPVPLIYVDSTEAYVQIPWELAGQTAAALTVTVNGQASAPQTVALAADAPGIFTTNGQAALVDNLYRPLIPGHPATAGGTLMRIFCTGLGVVTNPPASGAPAPVNPPANTVNTPMVFLGTTQVTVVRSILVGGSVGVYEVDVAVPADTPAGGAISVSLVNGAVESNIVTVAVETPDQRAGALLQQMTLDEKLQLVHGALMDYNLGPLGSAGWVPGIPRLGIPDQNLADGSVGVGNGVGQATALPSSIASAASWDLDEAYKYGTVIGKEMRAFGQNVNLGGNVNLMGREPRDGRTFETKGEDPVLAGRITAAHLRGIQDQHVIAGIKHYALNDQETGRTLANVVIDDRSARESDLLAFEIGVKDSNVQSVMCSYNLVNGSWACGSDYLLNQVLKGDWAFPGYVMSDWYATHDPAGNAIAGLDQEQPGDHPYGTSWAEDLASAVQKGDLPLSRLNDMVRRILHAMYAVGLFEYPTSIQPIDAQGDAAIAQEIEEQGAVLLKNSGGQLPLDPNKIGSIAVIGSHADVGVLSGAGSAQVMPVGGPALRLAPLCPPCWGAQIYDPSSPLNAIQAQAPNAHVQYDDGTNVASAVALARSSSVAVVFLSNWESEGMDLADLSFPNGQDALVSAIVAANPHTVVVLQNGGPQVMPWLSSVAAVLEAWFPGQRGGEAIANLLFGKVNPSGKLPMTFPASVSDLPRPTIPGDPNATAQFDVPFTEGFNVGYKWYDAKGTTPLFPFGFGLSYTTFSISGLDALALQSSTGWTVVVSANVSNTGAVAGAEVVQVYLGLPASTGEPPRRLVGWTKVDLNPGKSAAVQIVLDSNDSSHPLSYWDSTLKEWLIAPGDYTVYVGNSSALASLQIAGTFHAGP